jgi:hypothetical protein
LTARRRARLWPFAIAKSYGNPAKRVLEKRMISKESAVDNDTSFTIEGVPHMTLAQIEDEIRSLRPAERIELYKWLDHVVVADCRAGTSFCSRLGVDRALEIRHAIDQKIKITARRIPIMKSSHLVSHLQQIE